MSICKIKKTWKQITIFIIVFFLSGCSPIHLDDSKNINGFSLQPNKVSEKNRHMEVSGDSNFKLLKRRYGETEWKLNKNDKNRPPYLGLAMSGGGMRSASFNIGILKGLHEIKQLKKIDIMSSVSGGSYAMSWYYLQKYYTGEEDDVLFKTDGPDCIYQNYLLKHARMPIHSDKAIIEYPEYIAKATSNVLSWPLHWIANGLFDWNLNLAPYRVYYQNAIERAFHVSPCGLDTPNCNKYRNASTIFGQLVGVKKEDKVSFIDMQNFLMKDFTLPSFIINTTVKIDDDDLDRRAADFSNSIFEFSPFRYGSDSFGFRDITGQGEKSDNKCPVDIHTSVAISGAAVDSSIMPKKIKGLNDISNLNLGYNIPNYNIKDKQVLKHNVLPYPFYYLYRDKYDIRGSGIYLTDGGHSDNLGAFSLIKRMCNNIIIVDAEHDPNYEFIAYRKLKKKLKNEFGVTLHVQGVDPKVMGEFDPEDYARINDNELSDKIVDKLGLKRSSSLKVTYLESIGNTWSIDDSLQKKHYSAIRKNGKLIVRSKYSGKKPVLHGTISWFPLGGEKDLESKKIEIHIIYVKLSLDLSDDGEIADAYPKSIKDYYNNKGKDKKKFFFFKASSFPHEDTSDISYGSNQFKAYRDLGRYIIESNKGCFEKLKKCDDYEAIDIVSKN